MGTLSITLFADFISLESYLTELTVWRQVERADVRLVFRACRLSPPGAASLPVEVTEAAAQAFGSAPAPPGYVPSTLKAHEAARSAASGPAEQQFRLAIYEAYWSRGSDIGRIDVLQQIAASVGLDPVDLKIALDIDRFRDDVHRDVQMASRLGVSTRPVVYVGTGADAAALVGFVTEPELTREISSRRV